MDLLQKALRQDAPKLNHGPLLSTEERVNLMRAIREYVHSNSLKSFDCPENVIYSLAITSKKLGLGEPFVNELKNLIK